MLLDTVVPKTFIPEELSLPMGRTLRNLPTGSTYIRFLLSTDNTGVKPYRRTELNVSFVKFGVE